MRSLSRRLVPAPARARLRRWWYTVRPPRVKVGVGAGLRFDPGPSNPAYARGDNETPVQAALAEHVRPGSVVVDIGANVGFFTVLAARLVGPEGRVIAFEPVPTNARYVRRNAALNGFHQVTVIERAVADRGGTAELVLAAYAGGAALRSAGPPPDATTSIVVDVTTLDEAVARGEIPPPDVVKIDVEGAEAAVLRGMAETMRTHRPVIICEVDDGDPTRFDEKHQTCAAIVEAAGYDIVPLERSYHGGSWIVGHFVGIPRPAA